MRKTAFKALTINSVLETAKTDDNDLSKHLQRMSLPITGWEQKGAPSIALDLKILKKTARIKKKNALKPIAVNTLLEDILININDLLELPIYKPPLDL